MLQAGYKVTVIDSNSIIHHIKLFISFPFPLILRIFILQERKCKEVKCFIGVYGQTFGTKKGSQSHEVT